MKRLVILAAIIALVTMLAGVMPAMAQGTIPHTITVTWYEDGVRYHPDGSIASSWEKDGPFWAELMNTGKVYRFTDIQELYNATLPDISGKVIITGGNWMLCGQATYTSLYSGLPIRDHFNGNVVVSPVPLPEFSLGGTYTQWSYAFGTRPDVLTYYPKAIPAEKQGSGWWFIGFTDYTVCE